MGGAYFSLFCGFLLNHIKALRAIRRALESLKACGLVAFSPWLLALSLAIALCCLPLAEAKALAATERRAQGSRRQKAKSRAEGAFETG